MSSIRPPVLLPQLLVVVRLDHGFGSHDIQVSTDMLLAACHSRSYLLDQILTEDHNLRFTVRVEQSKNRKLIQHLSEYKFYFSHISRDAEEAEVYLTTAQINLEIIQELIPLLDPPLLIDPDDDESRHANSCPVCQTQYIIDQERYRDLEQTPRDESFEQTYEEIVNTIRARY